MISAVRSHQNSGCRVLDQLRADGGKHKKLKKFNLIYQSAACSFFIILDSYFFTKIKQSNFTASNLIVQLVKKSRDQFKINNWMFY